MTAAQPATCERVSIPGPCGELIGRLAYGDDEPAAVCVLLNPHPHMGGHVDNPLVRALAMELVGTPAVTLRFDYSGVGESDGSPVDVADSMMAFWDTGAAPEDPRMCDDAQAAVQWAGAQLALPVVLVGYSFGAYLANELGGDGIIGRILICPTIKQHSLATGRGRGKPKVVVYSDNDFATPRSLTEAWITECGQGVESLCVSGGDHFLRDHETQLAEYCRDRIRSWVGRGGDL